MVEKEIESQIMLEEDEEKRRLKQLVCNSKKSFKFESVFLTSLQAKHLHLSVN